MFQSLSWAQVFKINHLGIQMVSMGRSQELSEVQVMGCYLCPVQLWDFLAKNTPHSTISGVITKWKQLGMPATHANFSWFVVIFVLVNTWFHFSYVCCWSVILVFCPWPADDREMPHINIYCCLRIYLEILLVFIKKPARTVFKNWENPGRHLDT